MMPPPGLQVQIYLRPRLILIFDLLRPSYCGTMDIYRNMCLSGLLKIRCIVVEKYRQKAFL